MRGHQGPCSVQYPIQKPLGREFLVAKGRVSCLGACNVVASKLGELVFDDEFVEKTRNT